MQPRIDTILFDAVNTLWHETYSILDVWAEVLRRFDAVRPPKEIFLAEVEHLPWLHEHANSLETSGRPASDETIETLWAEFNQRILRSLGIDAPIENVVSQVLPVFDGIDILYDDTLDVLTTLQRMGYRMAIVSNGVYQQRNAALMGIEDYFDTIIGSWHVGYMKPDPEIFNMALRQLGASPEQALMVGDTWDADVVGARSAGIQALHLKRDDPVDESRDEISTLHGVIEFLNHHQEQQAQN
ncbi:MAG: HAD family hydrolase [SAR202 cluster bacterium]|jgi:putative hydrolase of the HAD superfamily|nr:HAD family hydrolase [SAR202 cluster bacterium]MDP6511591.1 HAD family hydrolase [SAR202 cluster bacterium]